jgi:chromosome partitioning protein
VRVYSNTYLRITVFANILIYVNMEALLRTIVLAARKGGASKTTLTGHLAVEAARRGLGPVVMMDTDPQQSLAAWWQDRAADEPKLAAVRLERLAAEAAQLRHSPGWLFIDTPPLVPETIETVIAVADLVLIPVKPSPHDLKGVGVTVQLAKRQGKPFCFVVTQAIARAALTTQAILALSQHGPVATSVMHYRVDYAGAMTDGRTVQEIDAVGKAAEEMRLLFDYVDAQIRSTALAEVVNG